MLAFPAQFRYVPADKANYSIGRNGNTPKMIVLHTMVGSIEGARSWFSNPVSQVSTHFLVGKNGQGYQMVSTLDTAWANGPIHIPMSKLVQKLLGVNPNDYSVSFEIEGYANDPLTTAQYDLLCRGIAYVAYNFNIPVDRDHIIGHYEIDGINKKDCPGSRLTSPISPTSFDNIIKKVKAIMDKPTLTWYEGFNTADTVTQDTLFNAGTPIEAVRTIEGKELAKLGYVQIQQGTEGSYLYVASTKTLYVAINEAKFK